jgi:hypothetical protein
MDQNEMNKLYRGHVIDASYQVSYHLAKRFQRKCCFRNRPIRNKNCLWQPCLLTDRNGMSNSDRGPAIDASYHVSVHLANQYQSRGFLEIAQSEKKNCLWWPCLLMVRDKMNNHYREPSIDASYQVSVHLSKRFQRRRLLEINQSEKRIVCGGHVC